MTRRFRVIIPETTIYYDVDEEKFALVTEDDGQDRVGEAEGEGLEAYLRYKVEDDVSAAFELGSFGDDYLGITYVGGNQFELHGDVVVEDVKEVRDGS